MKVKSMTDLEKCLRALADPYSSIKIIFEEKSVQLVGMYSESQDALAQGDTLESVVASALVKAHSAAAEEASEAQSRAEYEAGRLEELSALIRKHAES